MAKKLSTQSKIKRLRAEGYSRKDLARSFGVSVSAIGRAERGQSSGKTIEAQANQFYKLGKRAKSAVVSGSVSLPSAKPAPAAKGAPAPTKIEAPLLSPIEKFEGKLNNLFDNDKIVIYINVKGTGKSVTLGAHGGIKVSTILAAPSVGDFLAAQGGDQGYEIDWDDVVSINYEEYY
jgi:transcriptional regulator with XRE-family HTH domain